MPARKRTNIGSTKKGRSRLVKYILLLLLVCALCFATILSVSKKYFKGVGKVNIAIQKSDGDVSLAIFDLGNKEITTIAIPGTTEVESAGGLGKYRVKNIWNLGVNEKLGGGPLLTRTLTSYFKFPVYIWADEKALNFLTSGSFKCYGSVVSLTNTNLSFGDKMALASFCSKVRNIDKTEIDLGRSTFLRKVVLADGESGYQTTGVQSPKLYSNFVFNELTAGNFKASIIDATLGTTDVKSVAQLMEVVGGKVSSISKVDSEEFDCAVKSSNLEVANKISNILRCKEKSVKSDDGNIIEIKIGSKFVY